MRLIKYTENYKSALNFLLLKMADELFGTSRADLESFIKYHWAIYIVIDEEGKAVGFTSFVLNTYYGLRETTLGNDYWYVLPSYRGTKAAQLLTTQAGYMAETLGFDTEFYYASEHSVKLSKRLKGTKLYDVYLYQPDDLAATYNKIKSRLERKTKK